MKQMIRLAIIAAAILMTGCGAAELANIPYAKDCFNGCGKSYQEHKQDFEGTDGTDGTDGSNGTVSSTGSTGSTGQSGSNGSNGSDGTDGSDGEAGATGDSGSNGVDGNDGVNGTDGASCNLVIRQIKCYKNKYTKSETWLVCPDSEALIKTDWKKEKCSR